LKKNIYLPCRKTKDVDIVDALDLHGELTGDDAGNAKVAQTDAVRKLGQAEAGLDRLEQDVEGLDVAMDDAHGVHGYRDSISEKFIRWLELL